MTNEGGSTRRPGTRLIIAGTALTLLGIVFCIGAFATTHVTLVPGTLRTVETQGTPGPLAWIILLAGLVLAGVGLAKRR